MEKIQETNANAELKNSTPKKKRRRRFGDRHDGRRVRSLDPMCYVAPFIMKDRNDSSNLFRSTLDMEPINEYIRHKTRVEGLEGFGFMHVIVAAYLRVVASHPGLNRFIAGQRIYSRDEVILSMMVKKTMALNAQESAIKPTFLPSENIYDVYRKMQDEIAVARSEGDTTELDTVARAIVKLPTLLLRGFVGLMKSMDYFGIMPKIIHKASPFHASIFISNLGSLGIQPIYHHLYNFGNVPVFITFGALYRKNELADDGTVVKKKYIDYTVVTDERITDGHYYADAMKELARILKNPSVLDSSPETIVEDIE